MKVLTLMTMLLGTNAMKKLDANAKEFEPRKCRICLFGAEEGNFESPCAGCRGSSSVIHFDCFKLQYAYQTKNWRDFECPTCKLTYEGPAAVVLAQEKLNVVQSSYPIQPANVFFALRNLAHAYHSVGDYEMQCQILQEALPHAEVLGNDNQMLAWVLGRLGHSYGRTNQFKTQLQLAQRALEIRERINQDQPTGENLSNFAHTLLQLANAHGNLGNYDKQLKLCQESVNILEKLHGPNHTNIGAALSKLGQAYGYVRMWTMQVEYQEKALKIKEKAFGKENYRLKGTLIDLGFAYRELKNYEKQMELHQRALEIQKKRLGLNHSKVQLLEASVKYAIEKQTESSLIESSEAETCGFKDENEN